MAPTMDEATLSFDQVVHMLTSSDDGRDGEPDSRRDIQAFSAHLDRFLAQQGDRGETLERVETGTNGRSAVVLARRPLEFPWWHFWRKGHDHEDHLKELYFVLPAGDRPEVLGLVNRCDDARVQVGRISNASGRYRNRHLETLYSVACNLLRILDEPVGRRDGGLEARALAQVAGQLTLVEERFQWVLQRNATVSYLRGVVLGFVAAALPAVALLFLSITLHWPPVSLQPALLCFAGGAVTASTNALLRITQGTLTIVGNDSHLLIGFYGSFRPFIGAVFAVVLYAMVSSKLVNLTSPTVDNELPSLIIAFAAGFSEGLVPDLVSGLKLSGGGR
jgi:hypothetical protein